MATRREKQKTRKVKSVKTLSSASEREADTGVAQDAPRGVPLKLQQQCLDVFRDALKPSIEDAPSLQEVKGHLFDRDFATAFGNESYLRVYASRWSPSRALAYLDVLVDIRTTLESHPDFGSPDPFSALCLGGGAGGELVGLAGWLRSVTGEDSSTRPFRLDVALVDIADWTSVVHGLHESITTPPQLSKYASQARKNANEAMVGRDDISVSFLQQDVLDTDEAAMAAMKEKSAKVNLITFMFTLNELYSTSMSKTQQLLLRITDAVRPGTLFLVVDSPGSYSTVSLNGAENKHPMQWLLDYTLLGPSKKVESDSADAKWEKVIEDSSRWFRLPEGLNYPIELENMRYQIHLYRRLNDDK